MGDQQNRKRRLAVEKWLDDNELDYTITEMHDDLVMLRPHDSGASSPLLLFMTGAGWQPWQWLDCAEEGWSELYDLDEVQ